MGDILDGICGMVLRPAAGDRRFQYKAFHGIPTTVRPLGVPYSDIYDVAAACELRFRYKAHFTGFPQRDA